MGYEFVDKGHEHLFDGKKMKGVTTVINSIIAKPALLPWVARTTCEYIKDNLKDIKDIDDVLKKAQQRHRKKKDHAGDHGKAVHKSIEKYIKKGVVYDGEDETVKRSFFNFLNWVNKYSVVFLSSERNVYNQDLWLGGIIDGIAIIEGKKWLIDFKTGSGIYREAFLQLGAYDIMTEENIDGYWVINLKKDGSFDEEKTVETKKWREGFLACLSLYNLIRC